MFKISSRCGDDSMLHFQAARASLMRNQGVSRRNNAVAKKFFSKLALAYPLLG
jgi:hypothetical protein